MHNIKKHTTTNMRNYNIILSALLLAIPFCVTAQEEVFPTGTVWKEVREVLYDPRHPEHHTPMDTLVGHIFEIGPDTVIGKNTYKQVFKDEAPWDCVIREEDGCVWMLADGYAEEFKLYDFNWDGRDTIVTQYLREQDRYASWVAPEDDHFPLSALRTEHGVQIASNFCRILIRNLGCVADLNRRHCLLAHRMMYDVPPALLFYRVLWLRKNGKEVYRYYGKNEWTTGIHELNVTLIPFTAPGSSYDLQGRRLSGEPARGMYIKDGRKYVKSPGNHRIRFSLITFHQEILPNKK